jgi:hypothetical protein
MLFSALSEEQQKDLYNTNSEKFSVVYNDWFESSIDHFVEALEFIGFNDVRVRFSGFWSQGDGAHFTGSYSYKKGALAAVKKEYPNYTALHNLAQELQSLQSRHFYSIEFTIKHKGRYSHELSTIFDFEDTRHNYGWVGYSSDPSYKVRG